MLLFSSFARVECRFAGDPSYFFFVNSGCDEALEGILRCFGGLSFQERIAVHIVDQVAEVVALTRSFQSDAADVVHSHLLHSPEDVFHSHSDLAHSFVEGLISFAQWLVAIGFAH